MGNDFKVMLGVMIDNSSLSQAEKDIAKQRIKISADISVEEFAKSKKEIEGQIKELGKTIKTILGTSVTDKQANQWAKQYYSSMVSEAKKAAQAQEKQALAQQRANERATRAQEKQALAQQRANERATRAQEKQLDEMERVRQKTILARQEEEKRQQLLLNKSQNDALREEYELKQKIAAQNSAKSNKIQSSVNNGDYSTQILKYETDLKKAGIAGQELDNKMSAVRTAYNELLASTNGKNIIPQKVIDNAQKLDTEFVKLKNNVKSIKLSDSLKADDLNVDSTITRLNEQLRKNSAYSKGAKDQIRGFIKELEQGSVSKARLAEINIEAQKLHTSMANLNKIGKSFGQSIREQASKFTQWIGVTAIVMRGIRSVSNGINTIHLLDTALVDLKKTSNATASELKDFYYESNETAKSLGVTTEEVINAASAWSRLGYSIRDAKTMAENSSIFASISPEMDIDTATDGLVSMMKAFDIDAEDSLDGIISKVNAVGNSFAISNEMIVEAMQRSSSAMVAANNSLDQTIAMNTAA